MSDPERSAIQSAEEEPQPKGVNLVLVYSLVVFALLAAISLALFMVLPFYNRH